MRSPSGGLTATLQDSNEDIAAFFAQALRGKTTVGSRNATAASAATASRGAVPDSAAVPPEILCVSLDSIAELPSDMRTALKRGDANVHVADAQAPPVEAGHRRQHPRAALMVNVGQHLHAGLQLSTLARKQMLGRNIVCCLLFGVVQIQLAESFVDV